MSDDRSLLMQAKELIDQHRYQEARAILESMPDNETAQNWLVRLNERAPLSGETAKPKRNMPDVQFEGTIPMIPQVTTFIQDMVIARVGMMGAIALVLAVVFGITGAIELTYVDSVNTTDLNIIYVILLTVVTAINFYALSYMLSLAFPQLERNHLLSLVAFTSLLAVIAGFLQYNFFMVFEGKESILSWILRLLFAGGVTYVFSSKNTRMTSASGPKLHGDNQILFFIGFIMLSTTAATLVGSPIIGEYTSFFSGLVSGMVLGTLTGIFTYIGLKQAQ